MSVGSPPRRDEILEVLAAHREELQALGVKSLSIFGSVARDEARPDSDVDVLVEVIEPMGYFGLGRIMVRLEEILGRRVDLGTRSSLRDSIEQQVLSEAVSAL